MADRLTKEERDELYALEYVLTHGYSEDEEGDTKKMQHLSRKSDGLEEFDMFSPMLEKAKQFGRFYKMLALKGNPYEYVYKMPNRRAESDKHTKASVLIYDTTTYSLDWKSVYRNTKGSYFKKNGKNFYIN